MGFLNFQRSGFSFCAFVFFALSLLLPSGYSYGAVGLLLLALSGCLVLRRAPLHRGTWLLLGMMLGMGLLWGLSFDQLLSLTGSDLWPRYWLAALTLAVGAVWGVSLQAVHWGLAAGAMGAFGVACYQYLALGWSKAEGYTNAIQFGGIAMYLGMAAWAIALFSNQRKSTTAMLWATGACGIVAALLSETRGAWLIAPVLMSCMLLVLIQQRRLRVACAAVAAALVLLAAVAIPYGDKLGARAHLAVVELQQYLQKPQQSAETSIGQRLEQWRAALHMMEAKPLTGWGTHGFVAGKQALVDQGLAHPSIMAYGHTHNEIVDMLVKRGLLGLAMLMLFYAIPLCLFWPTRQRLAKVAAPLKAQVLGLRMAAALLPVAYFGFGWTQVFFAHNSGNMFYLFALVVFWSALQRLEGTALRVSGVPSSA